METASNFCEEVVISLKIISLKYIFLHFGIAAHKEHYKNV